MNITSGIVFARPGSTVGVLARLGAIAGVEVHASSLEGRVVITIESDGDADTAQVFAAIQRLDGVLAASVVYSRFETEPDAEVAWPDRPARMPNIQGQGDRQ